MEDIDSLVYFVQAGNLPKVKIGYTTGAIRSRMANLQTGSCEVLRLRACIWGGMALEEHLHSKFAADRLHGEWFQLSPEILAFLEMINRDRREQTLPPVLPEHTELPQPSPFLSGLA